MAEVKLQGVYRVRITEYERGWGERVDENDTKFFDNLDEARAYARHWEEGGSPDIFWRAEITKL